jgi:hypothetical protein
MYDETRITRVSSAIEVIDPETALDYLKASERIRQRPLRLRSPSRFTR